MLDPECYGRHDTIRSYFFGIIGSLIALTSLLKLANVHIEVKPNSLLIDLAESLIQDPWGVIFFVSLLVFYIPFVLYGYIDVLSWSLIRGLVRVLQVYKRKIAVTIVSLVGTLFLYSAFLLIR